MSEFEERVLRDLSELKAHMRWLVGEGNEGKVHAIEERVEKHEAYIQRMAGVGAVIGFVMTVLHFAFDYLRVRHP